jgi:hypothetical protein
MGYIPWVSGLGGIRDFGWNCCWSCEIAEFYFFKQCDVNLYICVYHHGVCTTRCTIIGEGECNIPVIIPNLTNYYVDTMCGHDQVMYM